MVVLRFAVSIEVDSLEANMPPEKLLEYVRVGIQKVVQQESTYIGLLPPGALSKKERVKTELLGVEEGPG